MNRRTFLKVSSHACVTGTVATGLSSLTRLRASPEAEPYALKSVAAKAGKIVGMYTSNYQLKKYPEDASFIAQNFSLIADGNDLKMDRLRPAPDQFDFTTGDSAV